MRAEQGLCVGCKKKVIVINGRIRERKNNQALRCDGSGTLPFTERQWETLCRLRYEEYARSLQVRSLAEIAEMPADLKAFVEIAKLYHVNPAVIDTQEYITLMSGPLGKFILTMNNEELKQAGEALNQTGVKSQKP